MLEFETKELSCSIMTSYYSVFVFNKLMDRRSRMGDSMSESKVGEAKEPKFERYPTRSLL